MNSYNKVLRPTGWENRYSGLTLNDKEQVVRRDQMIWDQNNLLQQQLDNDTTSMHLSQQLQNALNENNINKELLQDVLNKNKELQQQLYIRDTFTNLGLDYVSLKNFLEKTYNLSNIQYDEKLIKMSKERLEIQNMINKYNPENIKNELIKTKNEKLQPYINELNIYTNGFINKILYKGIIKYLKSRIKEITNEYDSKINNFDYDTAQRTYTAKLNTYNKQIKCIESKMKQYINNYKKTMEKQRKLFNTFRKTHYNETVENLFNQINVNIDSITPSKMGSIQDYTNYINKHIW